MDIFFDSSVILSFCKSKEGASALILDYCREKKLKGYISEKVIVEVRDNNKKDKFEIGTIRFDAILNQNFLTVVKDATEEELSKANNAFNNLKDAPIIASAKKIPEITHILSLDNGFFKAEVLEYVKPIEILKPGEFVRKFRKKLE